MKSLLLAMLCWLALTSAAAATAPDLERARELYEAASFEEVLEVLARVEAGSELSRREVSEMLFLRALTRRAMGSEDAAERDLERIAYLDPDYQLPAEAPPSMRAIFQSTRAAVEPLRLLDELTRTADGVRFAVRASGDPRGTVRSIDAACRTGDGGWQRGDGGVVTIRAQEGATVECASKLVGPGGAVLRERGTREAPLGFTVGPQITADEGPSAWPFVIAGAGVLVAAAIATVIIFAVAPPNTTVTPNL